MKRNMFTEEQIIGVLKEHEAGIPIAELCRKHGVSSASIYKWKAKYGGMDVSEAKRLKALEEENNRPHSRLGWMTPTEYANTFHPRRDLPLRSGEGSAAALAHPGQIGHNTRPSLHHAG